MMFRLYCLIGLMILSGCSSKPQLLLDPVEVTGTVQQGSTPLKGGNIAFRPFELGHPMTFKIEKDGKFKGNLVPGKYMYYIPEETDRNFIKSVDPKYLNADVNRFVNVSSGAPLDIKFD